MLSSEADVICAFASFDCIPCKMPAVGTALHASRLQPALMLCVLQAQTAQFVALRRKLSCKDGKCSDPESVKAELDKAVREVAKQLPDAHKAAEGLVALQAVRDNYVFASMQQALSPTVTQEVGMSICLLAVF